MSWDVTRVSILDGVKGGDAQAWVRFFKEYRALVWLRGSDYRLTETEQGDLLQNVMLAFFNAQNTFTYDPSKGRFRDYFRMIIRNEIFRILKARKPVDDDVDVETLGDSLEDTEQQHNEEEEWKVLLFNRALEKVKQTMELKKVQIFIACKLHDERPQDVAKQYGVSLATAYNYCNEVFDTIRKLVQQYDQE